VVISTRRRNDGTSGWRGQIGGWHGGQQQKPQSETPRQENPYLKEQVVEFEIDIDPVSLVSRIVSVREQLAKEFATDFDTIVHANDQVLDSYQQILRRSRDAWNNEGEDTSMDDMGESLAAPYSDRRQGRNAYDRHNAMVLLSYTIDAADRDSSPLRKSNFDLMILLLTQESIHRVLRAYAKAGEEREVSFVWLRDYYMSRVGKYFDGHQQEFGRADDFLEELLLTSPTVKRLDSKSGRGGRQENLGLVDPLRIAEDIIRTRTEVGQEWKEIVTGVPREHTELRKMLLALQMGEQVNAGIPTGSTSAEFGEGFE
jgi:hypothetical protein